MAHDRALWRLSSMSAKNLIRNRLTGLAPIFLFAWLLLIYFVLSLMLSVSKTDPTTSLLRAAVPSILMTGIAGIAFMATTVPLVSMRERGLLRLLGTTPLKRSTFLVAQIPGRIVLVFLEVVFIVILVSVAEYADETVNFWRLVVTLALGVAMLFALALLVASRARNTDVAHQGMTMLVMGLFVCSGSFLPPGTLPSFTEIFTNAVPSTWFAVALSVDLTATTPFLPIPALWGMMLTVTVVAITLALRRFEWDQEEAAPRPTPQPRRTPPKGKAS